MTSLSRRILLTLLAGGLSLAVIASAAAQEAEEPAADEAVYAVAPDEMIVEVPIAEFVVPTAEETTPAPPALEPVVEPSPVLPPQPAAAPAPATSNKLAVAVVDNRFQPNALTIAPGTTVTWTNNGFNIHTLTSTDAGFDSGGLVGGASFTFTFDNSGTYRLICRQHGLNGMAGQVIVQ